MGIYVPFPNAVSHVDPLGTPSAPLDAVSGLLPPSSPGHVIGATGSWTPGTLAQNSKATQTFTVSGARVGDKVEVSFAPAVPRGVSGYGFVSAVDTVTVVLVNQWAASVTVPAETVMVSVVPQLQLVRNDGSA